MKLAAFPDARQAAVAAAERIAANARRAHAGGRRFALALSGGTTPQPMFEALAGMDVPWACVQLFQVDERIAPAGSPERNFRTLRECLLERVAIPPDQVHPMPVDGDPRAAAAQYAGTLRESLGPGGVLDVVHLGLGTDGHTASLLPGDPAIESAADIIVSQPYQGRRRLSLSIAVISAARERVWLITGEDKRAPLAALFAGGAGFPAARVERRRSFVFADHAASSPARPPAGR